MASRSGITDPTVRQAKPLIQGHLVRCPKCLKLRNPDSDLRRLRRNEDYAMDLAVIYQCRRDRDGCGHCFAPADMRVFLAFLSGDLVPRQHLDEARARIAELEGQLGVDISGDKANKEREVVNTR